MRNTYKILVENPEERERDHFEDLVVDVEDKLIISFIAI
jgi:hypothetical protein